MPNNKKNYALNFIYIGHGLKINASDKRILYFCCSNVSDKLHFVLIAKMIFNEF